MSLTYTTTVATLAELLIVETTDANFLTVLPTAIDYGEQRCYLDLDVINLDVADASSSTTALVRSFTLPTSVGTFQVVSQINIITPAQTSAESGTRNPLTFVSRAVLDMIYPSTTGNGVPQFACYNSQSTIAGQQNILLGPWPDAAYRTEVVGRIQPTPLSSTTTTTFLTLYYPALFVAACMVFLTGWQKNFGAQADDPKMAQSWETQYKTLLAGASVQEARKRFSSQGWTAEFPEPLAAGPR